MVATIEKLTRLPLAQADAYAAELCRLLAPACTQLMIAGSVRRRRPDCGDIEVVCVPHTHPAQLDLFGEAHGSVDELDELCRTLLAQGTFRHRLSSVGLPAFGPRFKRLLWARGDALVPVDRFVAAPSGKNFGLLMAIRTGPADWSRALVTPRLLGGWLPTGYEVEGGQLWQGSTVVPVPTEVDLFRILQLPWIDPERRTATVGLVRGQRDGGALVWREMGGAS